MLPADRIPVWTHWRRRRDLAEAREHVAAYLEAVTYQAFPFRVVESPEAATHRGALEPELPRTRRIVRALRGPSTVRLTPGDNVGEMREVDVVLELFELHKHSLRIEDGVAVLAAAADAYEAGRRAAWLRTLNPFYWLDMFLSAVEIAPFLPLRLVGIRPARAARTRPGRVLRWWLRVAVLLGGALWVALAVGLGDDLQRLADPLLARFPGGGGASSPR